MVPKQIVTLLGVVFLSSPLVAGGELVHAPPRAVGDQSRTEIETHIEQTLTINGTPLESSVDNFMVVQETITEASPNGAKSDAKFEVVQINIGAPGGITIQFDSGNPDVEEPAGPLGDMIKFFKLMSNSNSVSTYGADHRVQSIEFDKLNDVPEMFQGELSSETLVKQSNQEINRLPGKEVNVGDTWSRNEEMQLGSGQIFYVSRTFQYEGPEDRNGKTLEHVTFVTDSIEYGISGAASLPLEVKSSELEIASAEGHLWYSPQYKQVVEYDDTSHIVGKLTLVANGQELPADLDLTMRIHTTVKME